MIITLTIAQDNKASFDIQVPSNQCIHNTLQILYENELLCFNPDKKKYRVFSWRTEEVLDIENSYEENKIFTADILKIAHEEE